MNLLEKLNDNDSLYAEQVRLLYKPFRVSVVATFVAAVLLAAIQWQVIDPELLWGWLVLITVVTVCRTILAECS